MIETLTQASTRARMLAVVMRGELLTILDNVVILYHRSGDACTCFGICVKAKCKKCQLFLWRKLAFVL